MDAAGQALFCVVGAQKALHRGLNRLAAVLLGTIGASGGGVVRDVLITGCRPCSANRFTRSPR
jgi:uncharacterized membrane protein YeiH